LGVIHNITQKEKIMDRIKSNEPSKLTKRQSQVEEQMSSLSSEIDVIGKEVASLFERFSSILRVEPTQASPEDTECSIVPLASGLRDMHHRLARVTEQVSELKRWCEL
jgi:hypothetical protein